MQDARRAIGQDVRCPVPASVREHSCPFTAVVGLDVSDPSVRPQGGSSSSCHVAELGRNTSHATDGHPPLAVAVTDDVVQEAPVLPPTRIGQRSERSDNGVGRDYATYGVVGQGILQQLADWPLD